MRRQANSNPTFLRITQNMKKLMSSRKFRENYTYLDEPVTVIRRDEILGTWTPNKDAIARRAKTIDFRKALPAE
jgi:hypothetical protein